MSTDNILFILGVALSLLGYLAQKDMVESLWKYRGVDVVLTRGWSLLAFIGLIFTCSLPFFGGVYGFLHQPPLRFILSIYPMGVMIWVIFRAIHRVGFFGGLLTGIMQVIGGFSVFILGPAQLDDPFRVEDSLESLHK